LFPCLAGKKQLELQADEARTPCRLFSGFTGLGNDKLANDGHRQEEMSRVVEKIVNQLKQTGEPVVLTINGKAEPVGQDVAAYQKLRQIAEDARVLEGIRQGIAEMNAGRTVSLDELKEHARAKHGIRT
jgi:PHD/YefM family antitoxin component YafN of YafNO toxin-antitoxin module